MYYIPSIECLIVDQIFPRTVQIIYKPFFFIVVLFWFFNKAFIKRGLMFESLSATPEDSPSVGGGSFSLALDTCTRTRCRWIALGAHKKKTAGAEKEWHEQGGHEMITRKFSFKTLSKHMGWTNITAWIRIDLHIPEVIFFLPNLSNCIIIIVIIIGWQWT